MPIGSSKLGVLGAGLVPGGTETFNAPGTFSIPPGVKKVSITGKGATGNPGNAGNPGNPGNPGTGGAGGLGGVTTSLQIPRQSGVGGQGGNAWKSAIGTAFQTGPNTENRSSPQGPTYAAFGGQFCPTNQAGLISGNNPFNPNPLTAESGLSGNAGSAGNTGNPGNPGNPSSGLGNTFCGGAGGNAGVAGAAGNGGSAGTGGGCGNPGISPSGAGGSGGTGAGSGGSGSGGVPTCATPPNCRFFIGGGGGGGAGTVNSGGSGFNFITNLQGPQMPNAPPTVFPLVSAAAGGTGNAVSNQLPNSPQRPIAYPAMGPTSFAGFGGAAAFSLNRSGKNTINLPHGSSPLTCAPQRFDPSGMPPTNYSRFNNCNIPAPADRIEVLRSGAGGGMGGLVGNSCPIIANSQKVMGSGGGGGGRGSAGNAGGSSPTPSGAAATPVTFNCVPVTPGGTAPITVGTPGGQIVISWNPQ